MRRSMVALWLLVWLVPGSASALDNPNECRRIKRQIEHFHQVADRARERKNEGWFDNTERHLDNLYNRLEQRCPAHIERAKALRARRQARALLKTAAKAAIRYFTFGLY
ncbi:MAG: hypothetical protein MJE66_15820 [Proteobacteria bacterium]|nr:hypothetical protein [Pseudomonadota bacterium]